MKKVFSLIFFILFILLLNSCKKEEANSNLTQEIDPKITEFLSCVGFDVSDIKHDGEYMVVEKDHVFKISAIEQAMTASLNQSNENEVVSRQKATAPTSMVNIGNTINIPLFISPGLAAFNGNITTALTNWTNINQCRVSFTVVGAQTATGINIFEDTNTLLPLCMRDLTNLAGLAAFPTNGMPGNFISIDVPSVTAIVANRRVHLFMHEIGHCLGLRHTNVTGEPQSGTTCIGTQFFLSHIEGTPQVDANSIMMPVVPIGTTATWTTADLNTMRFCYPDTYITPNILSYSIANVGIPNSRRITFNVSSSTGGNVPYFQRLSRFQPWSLSTPVQTNDIFGSGPSTHSMDVPLGTWTFQASRNNFGTFSLTGSTSLAITVQ